MTRGVSKIARRPQSAVPAPETSEETLDGRSPFIDEGAIADFIAFFRLLDKWDREVGRRLHK
jgi:hypothetical protein